MLLLTRITGQNMSINNIIELAARAKADEIINQINQGQITFESAIASLQCGGGDT